VHPPPANRVMTNRVMTKRVAALAAGLVVGAAANRWWRARVRARFEAAHARRFRLDADGVVEGAGEFTLTGGRDRAVLLLHGFNDTPQSMAYLAGFLNGHGYSVHVPRLPGHGVSLPEMAARSRAALWRATVLAHFDALSATHGSVSVVGQSMGGALAVWLAAERPTITALVLLAPYLGMPPDLQVKILAAWVAQSVVPYRMSVGGERSLHDPAASAAALGPGVVTARALTELRRVAEDAEATLPSVTAPTLYLQSREDNRITVRHAEAMYQRVGAADKALRWLEGCGHIISADYCRDEVARQTIVWLETHDRR
jgi:carboxylesterase